jgi:hypothetical protein
MRKGSRAPDSLHIGDTFDFWRVADVRPPYTLILQSEMKVPGEAFLALDLIPNQQGGSRIQLHARFMPRGLAGLVYWYTFYPIHCWIFKGLLNAMVRRAEKSHSPCCYACRSAAEQRAEVS